MKEKVIKKKQAVREKKKKWSDGKKKEPVQLFLSDLVDTCCLKKVRH